MLSPFIDEEMAHKFKARVFVCTCYRKASLTTVVLSVISSRDASCLGDTVGGTSYIYQRILGFCFSLISKAVMLIIL